MCIKNENNNDPCNCLIEILRIILILQENAEEEEEREEGCAKRVLGRFEKCEKFNTRPIMLFTDDATPWRMPVSKDPDETRMSSVFRLERIDGCCCTFRVLKKRHECHEGIREEEEEEREDKFEATKSFFTVNINCICGIRCLEDTFVACV